MIAVAVLGYHFLDSQDRTKQSQERVLLAIAFGQTVTVLQTLGAVDMNSMEWWVPVATVLNVVELVTFETDLLQFHGIATLSMPASYFGKLMLVLSSLLGLAVVHTGFVGLRRMGKFKARNPSLIRALDTLFLDF